MRQIISVSQGLIRQRARILGQEEAFTNTPAADPFVMKVVDEQINRITSSSYHKEQILPLRPEKHVHHRLNENGVV